MQKQIVALIGLLFCFKIVSAQELMFQNIGVKQGLPSSEVYRVIQDKRGFVWFSTDAGVCRFNGHSIKCYTTADGLPDNTVFDLIEDAKGRIWMNCYNGAICYLENDKFMQVAAAIELKNRLNKSNSIITSLQFDKSQNLWIGTTETLFLFQAKDHYTKLVVVKEYTDTVQCIIRILDNNKTLESANRAIHKVASKNGKEQKLFLKIYSKDKVLGVKIIQTTAGFNPKFSSLLLKNKTLLYSYLNCLYTNSIEKKNLRAQLPKTIICLNEDAYGNIWVGLANGGVYFYKKGNFDTTPQIYLNNLSISNILFDKENGIWLSSFEKGVFYTPFLNYYGFAKISDLATNIAGIGSFGSNIFVATTSNKIFSIHQNMEIVETPYLNETNLGSRINFFPFQDKLVVSGNKMAYYDTLRNTFYYPRSKSGLTYFGTSATKNKEGFLTFVAQGFYYVLKEGRVQKQSMLPARSTAVFCCSNGNMLIGTLSGLFELNDTSWKPVNNPVLAKERINYIAQDKYKNIFVATKNYGLFILKGNKWISVSKADGLISEICNYVFCDDFDTIWVGGNKGISFFKNEQPYKIQSITVADGLASNEISSISRRANQLFVGTKEGLCLIDLKLDFLNKIAPKIYISKVLENKKLQQILNHSELNYNQNNLSFFIECPTYKSYFSPIYSYILRGYSDSLRISDKEILEFQNLEPGEYKLEVSGINNNAQLSIPSQFFTFKIKPPFWKTPWFIFVELFLASGLIYGIAIMRINKIKKQEKMKTEMNLIITETRMSALQAQMNPHFIFNAINSIQSFILNNETQNAYDYLAKFAKMVRMVLNNSKQNNIKLETEIETLDLYVQMEQIRFKNSFDFEILIDKSIDDSSEISIPVMLIQPFIENAIWHGIMPLKEKAKGKIELIFSQNETNLEIVIQDNGIGRIASERAKQDSKHKSMGMQLVMERLALIKSSGANKASLEVTDLTNEKMEPQGTLIKIVLPKSIDHEY